MLKQKHNNNKRDSVIGVVDIRVEKHRDNDIGKRDSVSSLEGELDIGNDRYDVRDRNDVKYEVFDSWLAQDSKWRQSPEGGEDVTTTSTKKDRLELSDKSLDVSMTSSNVHLELLDNTSIRHISSNNSSPVMKEKKQKQKEKVKVKFKQKKKICFFVNGGDL